MEHFFKEVHVHAIMLPRVFYMDDETSRHTHFDNPQPILGFPVPSMFDFKHDKMNTESEAYFADGTFQKN